MRLFQDCGGCEKQEIASAISLWSVESESLAPAGASRISGGERAPRNPENPPRPAGSIPSPDASAKKNRQEAVFWKLVVEAEGIEPSSASTLQTVLHT